MNNTTKFWVCVMGVGIVILLMLLISVLTYKPITPEQECKEAGYISAIPSPTEQYPNRFICTFQNDTLSGLYNPVSQNEPEPFYINGISAIG